VNPANPVNPVNSVNPVSPVNPSESLLEHVLPLDLLVALAFHAKPRFTKDIDLFVDPASANVRQLLLALADFGFGDVGLTESDFSKPGAIVQLGVAPNRVDLVTPIDGVTFEEAWRGRVSGTYGRQPVFCASCTFMWPASSVQSSWTWSQPAIRPFSSATNIAWSLRPARAFQRSATSRWAAG